MEADTKCFILSRSGIPLGKDEVQKVTNIKLKVNHLFKQ